MNILFIWLPVIVKITAFKSNKLDLDILVRQPLAKKFVIQDELKNYANGLTLFESAARFIPKCLLRQSRFRVREM